MVHGGRRTTLRWALALAFGASATLILAATATWVDGDIFVSAGNGSFNVYDHAGAFIETITDGTLNRFTGGCAFRPYAKDALYTLTWGEIAPQPGQIPFYDNSVPHGPLGTVPGISRTELQSITFNSAGHFFVGGPYTPSFDEYDASGAHVATHTLTTPESPTFAGGTDFLDLSSDERTMFVTTTGRRVMRFDLGTGTQLADFAVLPASLTSIGGRAMGLRILPDGGVLLADIFEVTRFDNTGAIVQHYGARGDEYAVIALDPDGRTFWTVDVGTRMVKQFDIAGGGPPLRTFASPLIGPEGVGLCLRGELTAAVGLRYFGHLDGHGLVSSPTFGPARYGVHLECEPPAINLPASSQFEIRWGKWNLNNPNDNHPWDGQTFVMDQMTSAHCSRNPKVVLDDPASGFTTHAGSGVGKLNGVPGYMISWILQDGGTPPKGHNEHDMDTADITITKINDKLPLYQFIGTLASGRNEAQPEKAHKPPQF